MIDGGSSDGTVEVVQASECRQRSFISEPDNGVYFALNKGLNLASGEIIGFLHSDDVFESSEVLKLVNQIFSDPTVEGVYGDLNYVSSTDLSSVVRYWRAGNFSVSSLKYGWMPPHPTMFIRRNIVEKFGGFDTSFKIAADYDAMLRYLKDGDTKLIYLPLVLVRMRVGGLSNASLRQDLRKTIEDIKVLKKNGLTIFPTLLLKNLRKCGQFFVRDDNGNLDDL